MVGHTMLVEMHLKLQKLKSSPLQPFGGLSIMFLGDFIQLPFISDTPLYTTNIKLTLIFTKQTQFFFLLARVWENYIQSNKIILTRQM